MIARSATDEEVVVVKPAVATRVALQNRLELSRCVKASHSRSTGTGNPCHQASW